MNILDIPIGQISFGLMVTGVKSLYFGGSCPWIKRQLIDENGNDIQYDAIRFSNGVGIGRRCFTCKYLGFLRCREDLGMMKYSNYFVIGPILKGHYVVYCGSIIEK